MAPGLFPGDVIATGWLPLIDRWSKPSRWERWIVTLPDGSTGVKRVAGLPGELLSLEQGDLAIDGRIVLKGPRVLAELGSLVAAPTPPAEPRAWSLSPVAVRDEAHFAPTEASRRLLPVRDVGLAAIVAVEGTVSARVRARGGPLSVTWRLPAGGCYAIVAGRLDGRAVAVAWPVPPVLAGGWPVRSCLPAGCPDHWDVGRPWPHSVVDPAGEQSPPLALEILENSAASRAVIRAVATWRDAFYLSSADGLTQWSLPADRVFVLGDFPAGSRDSRQFGALGVSALRHLLASWPHP
jgi:hypothetical protein